MLTTGRWMRGDKRDIMSDTTRFRETESPPTDTPEPSDAEVDR
ncbi:hypothetical protein [Halogeometricum luteum]|nr:hypothetical protein [Halogeometricum sp. S3BR5-2]